MIALLSLLTAFVLKFPAVIAFIAMLGVPMLILGARVTTGLPLKFLNFLDPTAWSALGIELLANIVGLVWPPASTAFAVVETALFNAATVVSVACAPILAPAVTMQLLDFMFNTLLTCFVIRIFRAVWGRTR